MDFRQSLIILILTFTVANKGNLIINGLRGGGHTVKFCFNKTEHTGIIDAIQKHCNESKDKCDDYCCYFCKIPCGTTKKELKFGSKIIIFHRHGPPSFSFKSKKPKYETGSELTIISNEDVLQYLLKEEININLSHNATCNITKITNNSISCLLNATEISKDTNISVSVSYGYGCNGTIQYPGEITVTRISKSSLYFIYLLFFLLIIPIVLICICVLFARNKKLTKSINDAHNKEVEEIQLKFSKAQKKAFIEYQNSIDSFGDIGRLTPRHVLSFEDYMSRVFNLELKTGTSEALGEDVETQILSILLNKDKLIDWVDKIEKTFRMQDRNLIASLLTVVLFQHPKYFSDIMKSLIKKSVKQLKIRNEEGLLFRKSDTIVEKLVGNWISLCMFRNMKIGEIGKRFFNLYRAIKCKMMSGLIDFYTKKARYTLTFDHMMLNEPEYELIKIKVAVNVQIKMMDSTMRFKHIYLENIDVDVLSLDTISQVKEKIIDKAIMITACKENLNLENMGINLAFSPTDPNDFNLSFVCKTVNISLCDFDNTNRNSFLDKEYVFINTMKHYSLKSGMKFLLTSVGQDVNCLIDSPRQCSTSNSPIHLQMTTDVHIPSSERNQSNLRDIQPLNEEVNKEIYLMRLLSVKKSFCPFIDGFFQCLTNWNTKEVSRNSLTNLVDLDGGSLVSKELYVLPIYYLFSMFNDIAQSVSITNTNALKLWKSNSFILRFWVNIIKNPDFIFSVEKTEIMNDCLTTIASALMESCTVGSINIDINSPIVKQLFLEDIKGKYFKWWQAFINSEYEVKEDYIITLMDDIVQQNQMNKYYDSCVRSLKAMGSKISFE